MGDLGIDDTIVLALKKYDVLLWAKFTVLSAGNGGEIFWSH